METITALILSALLLLSAVGDAPFTSGLLSQSTGSGDAIVTDAELFEEGRIGTAKKQTNIYTSPSTGSRIVARLEAGETVEILRSLTNSSGKWYCVLSSDDATMGVVRAENIKVSTPAPVTAKPAAAEVIPANAKKGVVTSSQLNIRVAPNATSKQVGTYQSGDRVYILETYGDWGRTGKGWINMGYVYLDGAVGHYAMTGYVTASQLRIRSGPGTGFEWIGTLSQGNKVQILEQVRVGSTFWGCTSSGWVCMNYVCPEPVFFPGTGTTILGYARVDSDTLNIRTGPGTNYPAIGTLTKGDLLVIWKTVQVGDVLWGQTPQGWVCMSYVTMVEIIEKPEEDPTEPSEEPTAPSEEPTEPSEDPTEPSEEPTESSEEPTVPSEESTQPSEEPTAPSEESTEPNEEPTTPSEGAIVPSETSDDGTGDGSEPEVE